MDERQYQQLRDIGLEHEIDDEGTLESNEARREAISIARRIVLWPTLVVVLSSLMLPDFTTHEQGLFGLLLVLGVSAAVCARFAATACGWLAHRLCWGSSIPVRRMAITFALVYVVSLFGWVLMACLG